MPLPRPLLPDYLELRRVSDNYANSVSVWVYGSAYHGSGVHLDDYINDLRYLDKSKPLKISIRIFGSFSKKDFYDHIPTEEDFEMFILDEFLIKNL